MKQYSFIQEANWAHMAGNAIGSFQRSGLKSGAATGAAIGAGVNVAKNLMKSDDDKTKKGVVSSALSGATKGAVVGGAVGHFGGKLARSQAGQKAQQGLFQKAVRIGGDQAASKAISDMGQAAYDKSGNLTSVAKAAADKARSAAHSKYSLAKGQGDLFRHGIRKGKFLKNASDTIDIPYSN